jgi:hypothetical protein
MGTRSTTHILDENGNRLLCIYQQFDGYIEGGVGEKLIRLLEDRVVVNGYTMEDKERRNFNGMSCLAADVVAHFKDGIGGAYIQALDEDYVGSYNYTISCVGDGKDSKPQRLKIKMESYGEVLFDGFVEDYDRKLVVGYE